MKTVHLKKGTHKRVASGHLWVFSNELQDIDAPIRTGDDVVVKDAEGKLIGTGTYSPSSLIAVRLHARGAERPLDTTLIAERIKDALALRERLLGKQGSNACRLVNAEGDYLPGVIIDRYGEYLSVQCLTTATDRRTDEILDACEALLKPVGIVLKNDTPFRDLEGLPRSVTIGRGHVPQRVPFVLGDFRLQADLLNGQKTGFFFDQRHNYRLLKGLCTGKRVLDGFCYTGIWGMHAARDGAREVVCVDISTEALALACDHVHENGLAGMHFVRSDMLEFLRQEATKGHGFDVIVLDPPPYARSARAVQQARKGYINLNKWALRCLRPDGFLVTGSCSHHVTPDVFIHVLSLAGRQAGRRIRVVAHHGQAVDHPWIPAMPETAYLKMVLLHAS